MKIILASNSPRRKEILGQAGVNFTVIPSQKEEIITQTDPLEVVKELSLQKAEDVASNVLEEALIIGSDTIVSVDNKILGKPKDKEDAVRMLDLIQGNRHQVYTGVSVIIKSKDKDGNLCEEKVQFAEQTNVNVYAMTKEEIERYVESGEPMDKAGAYAIQGLFAVNIKGIEGDYYNVVGFPIARFYQEMKRLEINII